MLIIVNSIQAKKLQQVTLKMIHENYSKKSITQEILPLVIEIDIHVIPEPHIAVISSTSELKHEIYIQLQEVQKNRSKLNSTQQLIH